jgi:hypothetical protein
MKTSEVNVYEDGKLVGTFSCKQSAAAFIRGEYSGPECDILNVYIEEVEESNEN